MNHHHRIFEAALGHGEIKRWLGVPSAQRLKAPLALVLATLVGSQGGFAFAEEGNREDPPGRQESRPSLVVLSGHTAAVNTMAFGPDGHLLITGGDDGTVRLWDVDSGCQIRVLRGDGHFVKSVAFCPEKPFVVDRAGNLYCQGVVDGKRLLATADGRTTWVLPEADAREPVVPDLFPRLTGPAAPGRYLVTADWGSTVSFWDGLTGRRLGVRPTNVTLGLEGMALAPNGCWLAVAINHKVKLWNLIDHDQYVEFPAHSGPITSLAFSPDSQTLVTASWDQTVKLWRVNGRQPALLTTFTGHRGWVEGVAFSPQGTLIASAGQDGTARLWDVASGRALEVIGPEAFGPKITTEALRCVAFGPDSQSLAVGSHGGDIVLYDIPRKKVSRKLAGVPYPLLSEPHNKDSGHLFDVRCLAFSPDGRRLASGGSDATVRIWDVASGKELHLLSGHTRGPQVVAFSPDGMCLAEGGQDEGVRVWDPHTGRLGRILTGAKDVRALSFSKDCRVLASGGTRVILWDLLTGQQLWNPEGTVGDWGDVSFSPDGDLLVASERGFAASGKIAITVWNARTGKAVQSFHFTDAPSPGGACAAFTPDARSLVTVVSKKLPATESSERPGLGQSVVSLWDIQTWQEIRRLVLPEHAPRSLQFFPDHNHLMIAGYALHLVDLPQWRLLDSGLRGKHPFAGSADGNLMVTADRQSIRVFSHRKDLKEPDRARPDDRPLPFSPDSVTSMALDPTGQILAVADPASGVHLLRTQKEQVLATLVGRVDGNWVTLLPDNYYRCSAKGVDAVGVAMGLKAFPVDQFDLVFNRPDIVLERLGCQDKMLIEGLRTAHQKRLARMGFQEEQLGLDMVPPHVELDRSSIPSATAETEVTLKIKTWDDHYLLDRLQVWINEVPVSPEQPAGDSVFSFRRDHTRNAEREVRLQLSSGMNKIQVAVLNEKGVASLKEIGYVQGLARGPKPSLWLLSVGISRYKNPAYNLELAAKDAEDMASFFQKQPLLADGAGKFEKIHVWKLTDEQATTENLLAAKAFLQGSRVNDVAIVFVSGHGFVDQNGDYYFGTYNVNFRNPAEGGLAFGELHGFLGGIPARNKLLLLDTCHAGETDIEEGHFPDHTAEAEPARLPAGSTVKVRSASGWRGVGGVRPHSATPSAAGTIRESLFADLRRETGAAVIGAAAANEYSCEGPQWRNGVFTYALLECLRTFRGDTDGDGRLSVSELARYVATRVEELTRGGQNPIERRQNPANDFDIAELSARTIVIGPPDQLLFTFSASVSPDGKLLATGHKDGIAKIWDLATGQSLFQVSGQKGGVLGFAFSPGGNHLLTLSGDGSMKLWDVKARKEICEHRNRAAPPSPQAPPAAPVPSTTGPPILPPVAQGSTSMPATAEAIQNAKRIFTPWLAGPPAILMPDEKTLVIRNDQEIHLADLNQSSAVRALQEELGKTATSAAASEDGRCLLMGYPDGTLALWDLTAGRVMRRFQAKGVPVYVGVSTQSKRALAAGLGFVTLWDTETGAEIRLPAGGQTTLQPRFSPDGQRIVLKKLAPDRFSLLRAATGEEIPAFAPPAQDVLCLSFSPDGRSFLTGGHDSIVRLWDARTGSLVRVFTGHRFLILLVAFLPSGQECVTVSNDNTAKIWSLGTLR